MARKSAFSAPKICTVEAGYFARFVRLPANASVIHGPCLELCRWQAAPAWEINLAPIISPISAAKLGATRSIFACQQLLLRDACNGMHVPDEIACMTRCHEKQGWPLADVSTSWLQYNERRAHECALPALLLVVAYIVVSRKKCTISNK